MEISVDLESISGVKRKLNIEIPVDVASSEFERVAKEYRQYARLPGFRQGKAPMSLVKRRFKNDIRDEVVKKLVPESYDQAVLETEVHPIGKPSIENLKVEDGEALLFEAHFEVRPDIELPEYKGLELIVEETSVSEEDIEAELEKLREENAEMVAVEDRPVDEGDVATVDLSGDFLDVDEGEEKAIKEEDVSIQVGDVNTLGAFNENLPGMNIGEEKTFEVEYADDYPEEKLAGRKVRFTVEVTDIKRRDLPEINDEFAKDLGDYDSLDALRDHLRERLVKAGSDSRAANILEAATRKLVEITSFDVPDAYVEAQLDQRLRDLAGKVISQGVDPSQSNIDWRKIREGMREDVTREVRTDLILDEIAADQAIEISEEDLEAEVSAVAEKVGQPLEKVRQILMKDREALKANLQRRNARALVVSAATVKSPE